MKTETIERVRKLRKTLPTMPLKHLVRAASVEPIYVWTGRGNGDAMVATFGHKGYDVRAQVTPDYDCEPDGSFTDEWRPGAIQNPKWRPRMSGYDSVYRWYIRESGETIENAAAYYRRTMSKSAAWALATEQAMEDFHQNVEVNNAVFVRVEVSRAGIVLGSESIMTRLTEDTVSAYGRYFEVDPYVDDLVDDLLAEAVHEADEAVARLCDCPSKEGA